MRVNSVIFATILAVLAGTAWAEEAPPPPAVQAAEPAQTAEPMQTAEPTAQVAPTPLAVSPTNAAPESPLDLDMESMVKRERIWNYIMTLLYAKDVNRQQLRQFTARYLEFFPQKDDPHRETALYLIEQLDAGVAVKNLNLAHPKQAPKPLPNNGFDTLSLRLHLGRAFGAEVGFIGFRQGYFAADLVHFTLFCPYGPAVILDLGTSLGTRIPLGTLGRDELRFLLGVSWIGMQLFVPSDSDAGEDDDPNEFVSDLGVSAEFSYVHRYDSGWALQLGVKSVIPTIKARGYFIATGFVGLRL